MPKLYLLRHAQAASSLGGEDKDRPLTPQGIGQAKSIGPHLQDIDLALCSSARRTKETLKHAGESGATIKKIETLDILYNAMAGELLNAVQSYASNNILVVAHNPGIHQFAKILTGDGEPDQLEKLNLFYNPATLSIFDCPIESWRELKPAQNKLIDLVIPD